MMNAQGAGSSASTTRTSSGPTGSTRPATSRARATSPARAHRDAAARSCAQIVRQQRSHDLPAAACLHTWNDLLGGYPGPDRRQDGPHPARRLVAGRRGAPARTSRSTRRSSAARPRRRNADLAELLAWGLSRYRAGCGRSQGHASTRTLPLGYGQQAPGARAPRGAPAHRPGRPAARRAGRRADRGRAARRTRAARSGAVRVYARAADRPRPPLVAAPLRRAPGPRRARGWYAGRTAPPHGGWVP